jgi:ABC-2 type transport system permease protein
MLRAMLLGFVRDRGALAMGFLLPVAFFLVFAAIFGGATGQQMSLRVALADEQATPASARLVQALREEPSLRDAGVTVANADEVRRRVRTGAADVGLVVRRDGAPVDRFDAFSTPPLLIVCDPAREVAARMLAGLVQRAYVAALPDAALASVSSLVADELVSLSEEQRRELAENLAELRAEAVAGRSGAAPLAGLVETEAVAGRGARQNHVAYYAGAIAVLFLLFSAAEGALSLLEEKEAGILDRLLAGPAGSAPLLYGKLAFIAATGFVQVMLIFVVAWALYGVDLPAHLAGCALVSAATALAGAGLLLALVSACRTRRQAQAIANISILVLSALGGSMVPRFLMPAWMQDLGRLTPNAWALDAFSALFWRDEGTRAVLLPAAVLAGLGLAGAALALRLSRRYETL